MGTKILTEFWHVPGNHTLKVYEGHGGYSTLPGLFAKTPGEIIDIVKASSLRGRGGAGFPAGLKWSFVPKDNPLPRYVVVNADEGEPGTFKDRYILELDPHRMIEGIIACAYAIGSHHSYVYCRGEFREQIRIVQAAIDECYAAGILGESVRGSNGFVMDITVHQGAGAYICGEETALLESLEGKKGQPRIKPPFPAVYGAFGCPTVVNNVETLAAVPWILTHGAAAYAAIGTERSKGTKLWSVSGHINKPGVYEVDMGYPMLDFINNECGGIEGGRALKACIPGGSSSAIMTPEEIANTVLDYESIAKTGAMLGSGGMMVLAEGTDLIEVLKNLSHFYHHESCGQCTPCREGTGWIDDQMSRLQAGLAEREDLDLMIEVGDNMCGRTICVLADSIAIPVRSYIQKFRPEFDAHIHTADDRDYLRVGAAPHAPGEAPALRERENVE